MGIVYAGAGRPAIYVHSANLTTAGRVLNMELKKDAVDVTAFSDSAHRNLTSLTDASLRYDGLFNDAAAGGTLNSHGALKDLLGTTRRTVTIWPAGDGTGTLGVGFGSAYGQNYKPGGSIGGFVSLGADIMPDGTFDLITSMGSIFTLTTGTATTAGPDVDGVTVSTSWSAYIHVFANVSSGTGWTINVESSTGGGGTGYVGDGGVNLDFGSGTVRGTYRTSTSTLRRYRRYWLSSGGTGSITAHISVGTQ